MGAAHSAEPRSVSMDNPTPAGVLDISDDVVKRLKKGVSKQVREKEAAASTTISPAATAKSTAGQPEAIPAPAKAAAPAARAPTVVYQNPTPTYLPAGVTVTAGDVRRQMETELQKNDALWRERMVKLEETLKKTNSIMEKEYSTAVENVRARFAKAAPTHQLPPCQDLKAQVLACYRAHPGETLLCSEEVAMFRNCVSAHRLQKLDAAENDGKQIASNAKVAKAG